MILSFRDIIQNGLLLNKHSVLSLMINTVFINRKSDCIL